MLVEEGDDRRRRLAGRRKADEAAVVEAGKPSSLMVGISGQVAMRFGLATASARTLPPSCSGLALE